MQKTSLLLLFCAVSLLTAAIAESAPATTDTVLVGDLVVLGDAGGAADPADVALSSDALAAVAPWNAGDLEALLPATSINVNSRGESLLMIRGAPERHVTVSLDGIPLVVPWDERADLSLIPLDGVSSLRAVRGAASLLHGPNGVAGSLDLRTGGNGPPASVSFQAAEGDDFAARATLRTQRAGWTWLVAASARDRGALMLPDGADTPFHQADAHERTNSDLRQASALMTGRRDLDGGGRLSVLLLTSDAERGVAPETHQDTKARLWRLPLVRRGLAGVRLERPLGDRWSLDASAAADLFAQDIREYEDDTYTGSDLTPGDELDQGRDHTGHLRMNFERGLSGLSSLNLLMQGRVTRHRERAVVDGPHLDYTQQLVSGIAELNLVPNAPWTLRLGAGLDAAATPATGDKPSRDAQSAPALLARLTRDVGRSAQAHVAVSRRSRFPALREAYSGALGKFAPNPDLAPERQTLAEAGFATRSAGWEAGVTGFVARLGDGIVKELQDDGRFMRVNRSRIDTRGLELVLARRFSRGLTVGLHHSLLHARVGDDDGGPESPAEDRPSHQGSIIAEWKTHDGWHMSVVGNWIGQRASADATDTVDGLMDLDAETWWDAWVGRSFAYGTRNAVEFRIGVRNLGDAVVWEQTGLPGAGRTLTGNVKLTFF